MGRSKLHTICISFIDVADQVNDYHFGHYRFHRFLYFNKGDHSHFYFHAGVRNRVIVICDPTRYQLDHSSTVANQLSYHDT